MSALSMACVIAVCCAATPVAARSRFAGKVYQTQCQKNLGDGRILVTDDTKLPDFDGFKVLRYKATATDSGWSTGPCTIKAK